MTLHSLPIFVRLAGRPVILVGEGEAAAAKRRLLERAGATVVGEEAEASLAIVACDPPEATVARLRARGVLVNAVDRPDLCDFTLPAIVDRAPVLVAVGTGGVSAGLAAALRQRLEGLLPADLGRVAERLHAARGDLRERYPDAGERRRAIAAMLAEGGALDLFRHAGLVPASTGPREQPAPDVRSGGCRDQPGMTAGGDVDAETARPSSQSVEITLTSPDPDDLTLRQARWLANADRVVHHPGVPTAILDRARADAERLPAPVAPTPDPVPGLTVVVRVA